MDKLSVIDFTREEVKKRMRQQASALWQVRVKDVEAADPLVSLLMDACAFEFENMGKAVEATRQRILDRLASVMCPEVIDLPRPAHAVFHCRPEDPVLDLPQTAQFYHRKPGRSADETTQDLFFSPVVTSRIVNGDVRYMLCEQGLFQLSGRDRVRLERNVRQITLSDYQSVWLGLELNHNVQSLAGLTFFFDWDNESERAKNSYYRKLHDPTQTRWVLNGRQMPGLAGFRAADALDTHLPQEIDVLHELEQEVMAEYDRCFLTLGEVPTRTDFNYDARPFPANYVFDEKQQQRYFSDRLVWLELRLSRDFPSSAIDNMEVRINCMPVMNRHLNETIQRLQQTLNVYSLRSPEEFLFIRRVFNADSHDLYRSSPLRNVDELEDNSFMWRPHGVGRFDTRNAREILHYVQQMLLEESKAFSALGSGLFVQTIENLNKSVEGLNQRLLENAGDGFMVGHPYIFVKPREKDANIFIEFWSTNGRAGNGISAGTRLGQYEGRGRVFMRDEKEDLFLVTGTVGGGDKPNVTEKEYQLRRALLTRSRLVTMEDIKAECRAYLYDRIGGTDVAVDVRKSFAEGLLEGAGYVRCIDVLIRPLGRTDLSPAEWEAELERCQRHLATKSAMNLPYRVRLNTSAL
jgi:hypothetical protein